MVGDTDPINLSGKSIRETGTSLFCLLQEDGELEADRRGQTGGGGESPGEKQGGLRPEAHRVRWPRSARGGGAQSWILAHTGCWYCCKGTLLVLCTCSVKTVTKRNDHLTRMVCFYWRDTGTTSTLSSRYGAPLFTGRQTPVAREAKGMNARTQRCAEISTSKRPTWPGLGCKPFLSIWMDS